MEAADFADIFKERSVIAKKSTTPNSSQKVYPVSDYSIPLGVPFANRTSYWLKILAITWCIILMFNGIFAFILNYYLAHDKGDKETYFEGGYREYRLEDSLKIRITLIEFIDEPKIPKLLTDDRGWYERTYLNLEEGLLDSTKFGDMNGYKFISIVGYILMATWIVIGILGIFKFTRMRGIIDGVSLFLQVIVIVLHIIVYQMVILQYDDFNNYYEELFKESKSHELFTELKKSAKNYIRWNIVCFVIAGIHLCISLYFTFCLTGKRTI